MSTWVLIVRDEDAMRRFVADGIAGGWITAAHNLAETSRPPTSQLKLGLIETMDVDGRDR